MINDARRRLAGLWPTLCLLLIAPVWVGAQLPQAQSDAFAAGQLAFERGDYRQALEHFQEAAEAGAVGPATEFDIGVCHYKLAEYVSAAAAFEAVAAGYPAMRALAQYNLGLALLGQRRPESARIAFSAARGGGDPKIASLAERQLARLGPSDSEPARRGWALVDLGIGHDDNVALIDTSVLAAESAASPFTEIFAIGSQPLAGRPWTLNGSAYWVRYPQADEFDQTALQAGASYATPWGAWRVEIAPFYGRSTLGGRGFEERLGARVDLDRSLSRSGLALNLRLVHEQIDGLDSAYDFVAGSRDRLGARLSHRGPRLGLSVGYEHERNDRDGASVSPRRDRLWLRSRYRWNESWALEAQILRRQSRYEALTPARRETFDEVALGALRPLPRGWQLEARYARANNDSNDPTYGYRRGRIVVVFDKGF